MLSIALIGWAGLMRALMGTWLQPAAFFALWWCFAGILPLIFAPHEIVGTNAMFWLLAASIAISVGSVIGNGGFKTRRLAVTASPTDRELYLWGMLLTVSIVLGIGSSMGFAAGAGLSFRDFLNIEKLVIASNRAYFERYIDGVSVDPPVFSRALLPFVYVAPLVGGVIFVLRSPKKWKLISLLSFLPGICVTMLQTTKAAVLWTIGLWLSGYFVARLRFGKLAVFTKRHLLIAAGVGASLTLFLMAVSFARLATTDITMLNIVVMKLFSAAFGHMTVFSQWLTEYASEPFAPSLGAVTFAGPLEMLGYSHRMPGLFDSLIELVAGETSNVFTGFRPLIEDFTIPGALAILGLMGFVGGAGFRMVAAGRWSGMPLLVAVYMTIFWTPITWFWIYNSLTATVLALGAVVLFIRLWRGVTKIRTREQRVGTA
jgi:oligosaccharide repeat unit polymerase